MTVRTFYMLLLTILYITGLFSVSSYWQFGLLGMVFLIGLLITLDPRRLDADFLIFERKDDANE